MLCRKLIERLFSGHHERQVDEHGVRGGRVKTVHRAYPGHNRREANRHARHLGLLQGRGPGVVEDPQVRRLLRQLPASREKIH